MQRSKSKRLFIWRARREPPPLPPSPPPCVSPAGVATQRLVFEATGWGSKRQKTKDAEPKYPQKYQADMTKCRRPRNCFRYFVLFSLFGSIWKHLDTDCFRYFVPFWHWKDKSAKTVKLPNGSKNIIFGSIWRGSLFSLIFLFSVKTVQNSENGQYQNASKCFQ